MGQFGPRMDVAGGLIHQDLTTELNLYAINSVFYLHKSDYNFNETLIYAFIKIYLTLVQIGVVYHLKTDNPSIKFT